MRYGTYSPKCIWQYPFHLFSLVSCIGNLLSRYYHGPCDDEKEDGKVNWQTNAKGMRSKNTLYILKNFQIYMHMAKWAKSSYLLSSCSTYHHTMNNHLSKTLIRKQGSK